MSEPKIYNPAICPNCGWPQDQLLSRIDVKASTAQIAEGNAATPSVMKFTAVRSGPLDNACSVKATLAGTTGAADFEEGTAMEGLARWEPGDGSERSVEIRLNPDRIVESDEQATVTISEPQGCTIGTAAATVLVVNDDLPPAPQPSEYNEDLPYGGLGMGTSPLLGQPGNQKVYSESSFMIRCERSGQIASMSWNNRFNGHGRTGYSDGDGGVISWRLRVVEDPKASPIKPGPILGETRKVTAPVKAESWAEEWKAAGGSGAVDTYFAEMPTFRFVKPVPVKQGQMLLFTQVQHAPARGKVSINNAYTSCRSVDDWSPFSYHKSCRQFLQDSLSRTRPEHFPLVVYGYTDGMVKGTGGMGDARGLSVEQESIMLGGKTRVRQVFTVPDWADGRIVRRVTSWWGRYDKSISGDLRCRLKLGGSKAMTAADEGETLGVAQLSAGSIACRPDPKFGAPTKLVRHVFDPLPRPLRKGEVIYVEFVASGARMIGFRMVRWLNYAPIGLQGADWGLKGMGGQIDTGAGWASMDKGPAKHDCPCWLEF